MSFRNCWTISSSYHFQAHQHRSQRRCCFSQTALQWFEVLPGLSSTHPGLSSALRDLSLALPDLSSVLKDLSSALPGLLLALPGASRPVIGAPRCSPGCYQTSYGHLDLSPVLPGAPEGHCSSPVHSGIWPPWDSGPTTSRHSQRLPQTKKYCADEDVKD